MDKSQLSVTKKKKMKNPKTNAEEQGVGKGKALLSFDAAKIENILMAKSDEPIGSMSRMRNIPTIQIIFAKEENTRVRVGCHARMLALNGIMEALTCCDNNTIGVCGTDSTENADLLKKVSRRAKRDKLFDVIVKASVTQKPNNKRIQDEIADALGFKFDEKDLAKRAKRLRERIVMEKKILVILRDLCKGLDLDKVGIPFGEDHTGCKVLLTSTSEEVLSNEMFGQKIFKV